MKQGEGNNLRIQTQKILSNTSSKFKQNKVLWLAGMLTFFVPSVAAGAWYAGSNISVNHANLATVNNSEANATTEDSNATSNADGATATAGSASSSAGNDGASATSNFSKPTGHTEVRVNGKPVEVPEDGTVNQTIINSDGSTTSLDVSVNSQGGASGYSSTSTHMHSNSSSFSNGNGSSTHSTNITNTSP